MPVVADFVLIQEHAVNIGDAGTQLYERTFNTGGRQVRATALLMLMVRGLTLSNSGVVAVRINNQFIGNIEHHPGANANHWFTQMIPFPGNILHSGDNELEIQARPYTGNPNDNFDDFSIQSVVCFFHQNA